MQDTNKKKYTYCVFGLVISSEIELPELIEGEGLADISITLNEVPQHIENTTKRAHRLQISATEFLYIKNKSKFYVREGRLIKVEAYKSTVDASVRSCITEVCIVVSILQRGIIPIHGSSVVINGKSVIFTGVSGSGKSSLCFAFTKNKYEFLSDDISVVSMDDSGSLLVLPGFPQRKLCKDTAKIMGYDTSNPAVTILEKKIIVNSNMHFRNEAMPLSAIYEIKKVKDKQVSIVDVKGSEKLRSLINNLCYSPILFSMGIKSDYFIKCAELANKVSYHYMFRPNKGDTTREQMEHILKTELI